MVFYIKAIAGLTVKSFFEDVSVIGQERVPVYGPTIFVGNHSNQFVDACMLLATIPRYVRFLIAEVSLKRAVVGDLAKLAGSISVKRSQDCVFVGIGHVTWESKFLPSIEGGNGKMLLLRGVGTRFKLDAKAGDRMSAGNLKNVQIKEIKSDTELVLDVKDSEPPEPPEEPTEWKVFPKIDQAEVYGAVSDVLREGGCIGVFPEGGSHDRPELLPLKPGVAIMALNAAASGVEDIMIVPVGMYYYEANKLMSRASVQIGTPISVRPELGELYKTDRSAAVSQLMQQVLNGMHLVTVQAPDLTSLRAVLLSSNLFPPERSYISKEKAYQLYHIFSQLFMQYQDNPAVVALTDDILTYDKMLSLYGIKDNEVWQLRQTYDEALWTLLGKIGRFCLLFICTFPVGFMWGPLRMITHVMAEKHRATALQKSSVKISGNDVVASYKIIIAILVVPVMNLFYGFVFGMVFATRWRTVLWSMVMAVMLLPLLYYYSIRAYERLVPTARNIRSLVKVLFCTVNKWRTKEKELVTRRMDMQLRVREVVDSLLEQNSENDASPTRGWPLARMPFGSTPNLTQLANGLQKDGSVTSFLSGIKPTDLTSLHIEACVPRVVLDADSRRIRSARNNYIVVQPSLVESREEIL